MWRDVLAGNVIPFAGPFTNASEQANLSTTLKYGLQESTTLMPVSKMARVVSKST
jgi:hypothetical protein